ncbi:pyridoxal-dependent decarboxylase domain protein [Toxoplasma gondii p89]|uniref:Pyridoxal-dependent decarboxylase domain protein n=1 Tax=Toxoplasma gondii p89 TaxID=943119 RepID=A0A086JQL9_TOXGO|nr:pyridoxal-dependent decarboxylase domain protein [Toxoplasma gondii p89]
MQEAGGGGGEEAEEEGGGDACAEDGKRTELTRTKDCLQKLDEKLLADLFSSASPSFSSRLSPLHSRSPLDETTACQSTLCSQGDEDGAGDEEVHEGGKEKHREAEEESGRGSAEPDDERNKREKQDREPGHKPGGRHGKQAGERGAKSSEETRQQQRHRAPLCGFWMHSEVWAFLQAIHLARHFKRPPSDAFPHPAVDDHTQRRLKCEGLVSPSFFPACSSPDSWSFSTPVTGCARCSSGERRVYIFVCSGSPYIRALQEAFTVAGFADTGRIVAVHQNPDSGVMSVECLRAKMRDVQESEREVREARDKENAATRETEREEGQERKAADKGTHEERGDDEGKRRYSFVIVASAGRSGTLGGFDDFLALRQLAHETGSWLHVDGLVGGSFIFPREKPFQVLCAGMGLADSLTWSACAFLTGLGDPASPVAFFCRQDAVPLLLSLGHLPPTPTFAVASSSPSMPSVVEEPFVLRPSQGEEIGCGFPLWCFWKKLGDTGVANRVRQVYLRCRQLSLLLLHFPKRVKPPAFPETPKSRVATEERAYGGMRTSAFGGKQAGERKARRQRDETESEQTHRGENFRVEEDGGEKGRGGAEERDERRRLARASANRTSAGREPRENLTNAQQTREDREEYGEADPEEDEVGFWDDKPGNYDLAHKLEDDTNFLREHEDAVDHLVDAARGILSRDPEAFRRPVAAEKSSAGRGVPTPRMQALGRLEGGLTDSKRGRFAGVSKPLQRDLEAGRKAGTETRDSFYTGAGASWNAEQCRMCDSSGASQLRCNATRCMYTPGAFHVKQMGRAPSFSVSFWWIPPCLRGEVLSRATFSAAACQEIRFFVTLISRLLSLLLERERAGHRSEDHDNAVIKAPKGSLEAVKDSKGSHDGEFRLSSDALSIQLVDDDGASNSAIPDEREEQEWKGCPRRPPLLSVCILDPCVGEGDLAALLCLINRLGMLLIETGKANASERTSRLL